MQTLCIETANICFTDRKYSIYSNYTIVLVF